MANFFTDSLENRGTSLAHTMERWGNSWLAPLASYAKGKRYALIGKENHWDSGNAVAQDSYREKKMKESSFHQKISLVPGAFLGSVFKGLAYLSEEVRHRNANPCLLNRVQIVNSSYDEVTRRVYNRHELENRLSGCDPDKIHDLESAVQKGDWNSPIFQDQNFPYYGLKLLKDGKISQQQFGTIQIFWNAKENYGSQLKIIALFNKDGSINEDAKNKIKQTLKKPDSISPTVSEQYSGDLFSGGLFTGNLIEMYFSCMKKQANSEQFFFYIDHDDQPDWDKNLSIFDSQKYFDLHTISQEINYTAGINALGRVDGGRMIPTVGMMQQFLNVFFQGNAVKINPVIGLSTLKDIRDNGEKDTRDMLIAFPGLQLPMRADGFKAPGIDFTYHDFYHAILASCMLKNHRPRMIQIADAINDLRKNSWWGGYDLKLLRNRFIDMEFSGYRKDANIQKSFTSKENLFWYIVASTEVVHNQLEAIKWRFFAGWAYDQTAYRKKILTAIQPEKSVVQSTKEQFEVYMDNLIDKVDRFYSRSPTFQNGFKKAQLEKLKKSHPIHAYDTLI